MEMMAYQTRKGVESIDPRVASEPQCLRPGIRELLAWAKRGGLESEREGETEEDEPHPCCTVLSLVATKR